MDLAVVIVNWNSGKRLGRLLDSLIPLAGELDSVVVVDNASSDASSLQPPASGLPLEWLGLPENRGFAGGANLGVRQRRNRWILLLNPDIAVTPQSIRGLVCKAEAHPRAGLLCGPLLDEKGNPQSRFQLRRFPTWKSVLADVLFIDELRGLFGKPPLGSLILDPSNGDCPQSIEQPAAAYWLLRREAWQQIGGFDESFYPAWFEDVDFCKRLRSSGWQILFCQDCPVRHQGGYSLATLGRSRFLSIYQRNLLRFLKKHHPKAYPWLWLPVRLGGWARQVKAGFDAQRAKSD